MANISDEFSCTVLRSLQSLRLPLLGVGSSLAHVKLCCEGWNRSLVPLEPISNIVFVEVSQSCLASSFLYSRCGSLCWVLAVSCSCEAGVKAGTVHRMVSKIVFAEVSLSLLIHCGSPNAGVLCVSSV